MFEDDFPLCDRFLEDIWCESGNLPPARWKVAEGPTILGQVSRGWLVILLGGFSLGKEKQ